MKHQRQHYSTPNFQSWLIPLDPYQYPPDQCLMASELVGWIVAGCVELDPRKQAILWWLAHDRKTLEWVARRFNTSPENIRQQRVRSVRLVWRFLARCFHESRDYPKSLTTEATRMTDLFDHLAFNHSSRPTAPKPARPVISLDSLLEHRNARRKQRKLEREQELQPCYASPPPGTYNPTPELVSAVHHILLELRTDLTIASIEWELQLRGLPSDRDLVRSALWQLIAAGQVKQVRGIAVW